MEYETVGGRKVCLGCVTLSVEEVICCNMGEATCGAGEATWGIEEDPRSVGEAACIDREGTREVGDEMR